MAVINSNYYHRLSTMLRGESFDLSVMPDGPRANYVYLAPRSMHIGQYWSFQPASARGPTYAASSGILTYRVSSRFKGITMDLEFVNGGTDDLRVRLVSRGAYTGQFWIMTDAGRPGGGDVGLTGAYVNLTTTTLHGAGYKLDVT